jgi:hypothetical protein
MSNKPSPFPFPMKNNGGNNQLHAYNWFLEKENNSTYSGGNKPQQISAVQFDHYGPPTVITGTDISKSLTSQFVNSKNDASNDNYAKETINGGI